MSDTGDLYAAAFRRRRAPLSIDWRRINPVDLPDGSPIRKALEDGRPDVAAWLAANAPGRVYVQTETTLRRLALEDEAREAVASGVMSAREAERVYGVNRGRLT